MIKEDDLNSGNNRYVFIRLLSKAIEAGKSLEEYLQTQLLSNEEKEAIIEYQKKLK